MTPQNYNFPEQYEGDTFRARRFTCTRAVSGATPIPIDFTSISIKMRIKRKAGGADVKVMEVGDGITLVDATSGIFEIDKFTNIVAYNYVYDIQFTTSNEETTTYLRGKYKVIQE